MHQQLQDISSPITTFRVLMSASF